MIIKRLVPVYSIDSDVPKQWKNLRKAVYVTTFKFPYATIPKILIKEYGLKPDEKIVVFWTREISTPRFNRYRMRFRKVYSGSVEKYGGAIKKGLIRKKNTSQDETSASK